MPIQSTRAANKHDVHGTDAHKQGGPWLRQDLYERNQLEKQDNTGDHHHHQHQGEHKLGDPHLTFDDLSVESACSNPFGSGDSVTGSKSQVSSTRSFSSGSLLTNTSTSSLHNQNQSSHSQLSSNPNQRNRSLLNTCSSSHHCQQQPPRGCQHRLPSNRSFASETPSHTSRKSSASRALRKQQQQQQRDWPMHIESSRTLNSLNAVTESSSLVLRGGGRQQQSRHQTDIVFHPQPPSQQQQQQQHDHEIVFHPHEMDQQNHTHVLVEPVHPSFSRQQQRRASASPTMRVVSQQLPPSSSSTTLSSSRHSRPAVAAAVAASATKTRPQHGPPNKRGARPQPKPQRRASMGAVPTIENNRLLTMTASLPNSQCFNVTESRRFENHLQQQQQQQQQRRHSSAGGRSAPVTTTATKTPRGRMTQRGSQPIKRTMSLDHTPRLETKRSVSLVRAPRLEPSLQHDTSGHSTHQHGHYCDLKVSMTDEGGMLHLPQQQQQPSRHQEPARNDIDLFNNYQFEYACAMKKLEMKHARQASGGGGISSTAHPLQQSHSRRGPPQHRASTGGGLPAVAAAAGVKGPRHRINQGEEVCISRNRPLQANRRASAAGGSVGCCRDNCPQSHDEMKSSSSRRPAPKQARRPSTSKKNTSVVRDKNADGGEDQLRRCGSSQHRKDDGDIAPPGGGNIKNERVAGRRPSQTSNCSHHDPNIKSSNNNNNSMRRNQTERPATRTSAFLRTWSTDSLKDCSSLH